MSNETCPNGHPAAEFRRYRKNGWRYCIECSREDVRRREAQKYPDRQPARWKLSAEDRIREQVTADDSGCWLWHGWTNQYGYGRIQYKGTLYLAHRLSYETFVGQIPDGMELDHLCRVRNCVNPAHLEPVTHDENQWRIVRETCRNGHPWDGNRKVINSSRQRTRTSCIICDRESSKARWAREKQSRAAALDIEMGLLA